MNIARMARYGLVSLCLVAGTLAAAGLDQLELFCGSKLNKGLWQVDMLSTNDPVLAKGVAAAGQLGICMDVADRLAKQGQLDDQGCTPTIVSNTAQKAEITVQCKTGQKTHSIIQRESEQSFLVRAEITDAAGKERKVEARYQYKGECQGNSAVQMDKGSAACKAMGKVDTSKMAALCANAPENYRAQCEAQMKAVAGSCQ